MACDASTRNWEHNLSCTFWDYKQHNPKATFSLTIQDSQWLKIRASKIVVLLIDWPTVSSAPQSNILYYTPKYTQSLKTFDVFGGADNFKELQSWSNIQTVVYIMFQSISDLRTTEGLLNSWHICGPGRNVRASPEKGLHRHWRWLIMLSGFRSAFLCRVSNT